MPRINSTIQTPLGSGIVQGQWHTGGIILRLPVNDATRPHLGDDNCLTPRAQRSGLWVFHTENEPN